MKKFISMLLTVIMTVSLALSFTACAPETVPIPTYKITATASGGSINVSQTTVQQGEPLSITLTANPGYILESLTINGGKVIPSQNVDALGNYSYLYVAPSVLRDYTIKANFCRTQVIVKYTGEGINELDKTVTYGGILGDTPTPLMRGKRFCGWMNSAGKIVTRTTRIDVEDMYLLTAVWEEVSQEQKQGLVPQGPSTSYYNAEATDYGVVWHTESEPIASVVMVKESAVESWDDPSVKIYQAEMEAWEGEYLSTAIVNELDFETEYIARFGDYSADVWYGKEYTFTTREENPETVQFMFIADTQAESYIGERAGWSTVNFYDNGDGSRTEKFLEDTGFSLVSNAATAKFGNFDFFALGGDIVNYGAEPRQWREMKGSVDEYLFSIPTQALAGNHEGPRWYTAMKNTVSKVYTYQKPEGSYYDETGAKIGDFYVESLDICGPLYSFDYGPVHYAVLRSNDYYEPDSSTGVVDFDLDDSQVEWLKYDLKKAREKNPNCWLMVAMHEGPISGVTEGIGMPAQLIPIFEEYKVDMLLYGHNHYINSSYPVYWDESLDTTISNANGIVHDYKMAVAPSTVEKTEFDGVEVDLITLSSNQWGTILHEPGCGGYQWNNTRNTYNFNDTTQLYRRVFSGGKGGTAGNPANYSMYTVVDVSEDTLVVRTYGVDILGLHYNHYNSYVTAKDGYEEPSIETIASYNAYLDGFMLKKNIQQTA